MTPEEKKLLWEAMMHLEASAEEEDQQNVDRRLDAALYLVQECVQPDHRPANYDQVLYEARMIDAEAEAKMAIKFAKDGTSVCAEEDDEE